jgi:predicted small metal-binding protein
MIKLVCRDFGFECDFVAEGTMVSEVMELFAKHTSEEHGVRHSKDKMLFILRNQSKNNISKKEVENFFNKTYSERNRLEKWKVGRGNFP